MLKVDEEQILQIFQTKNIHHHSEYFEEKLKKKNIKHNKKIDVKIESFPLQEFSRLEFLNALSLCQSSVFDNKVIQEYLDKLWTSYFRNIH